VTSLRAGLLDGCRVALSGEPVELIQGLAGLGADVQTIDPATTADEDAAAAWVQAHPELQALVHDARADFAQAGVSPALERAWICARAVATEALIPGGAGGRLIFVAPADGVPLAEAGRAGLENLARTLGVEWARHSVTAVALCPGAATGPDELLALTAYLLSEAGGYFSGCRFDLGLVPATGPAAATGGGD
jgi:NAD(P)-dependent dehydrogenase (short-subunit alcohol dehydrogenase family)